MLCNNEWQRITIKPKKSLLRTNCGKQKYNVKPDQNPTTIYSHYSIPAFDDGKQLIKELGSEIKSNKYQVVPNSILIFQMSPDERIVEFNLITYDQMKKVSTNMKQIHTLEKLRDMLLPKLISGKVRVKYK
ncbi:MAG: hypothetical protein C5S46_02395 [Candidatus Methanomarinus sp.]|uniref:Uncharacterized protein n=1 Tax=Candidatus Methanomarinus sp. TaxID=3386244 RepID=A0AC61SC05_9EURY|nr:MAG: hypothetical protein C5S46_02395 [ANME-2 cluster archaeon]